MQHRPRRRRGGLTAALKPAIDITTALPRPADEVWSAATTPAGVNAELGPWVIMTFPPEALTGLSGAPVDEPLFVSWLLLLGVIPFDRHVFVLAEVGERHFIETSHSAMQSLWRHERYVTPDGQGGCTVRDRVTVVPRIGLIAPVVRVVVAAIFRHRHAQLRRCYG